MHLSPLGDLSRVFISGIYLGCSSRLLRRQLANPLLGEGERRLRAGRARLRLRANSLELLRGDHGEIDARLLVIMS